MTDEPATIEAPPKAAPAKMKAVTTKSGRPLVNLAATELPPPPPEPKLERVDRHSDIARRYYDRVNPDGVAFDSLSTNDQALWYNRAIAAAVKGGAK